MSKSLDDLNKGIKICTKCPLHKSRCNAVPGEGPSNARIFFLGEAPGRQEDKQGKPFIGKSGKYLDELLANNEIIRERVFITSSVKCRPPGNRKPTTDELKTCKKNWLDKQISIINPKLIVLLGKTAVFQISGRNDNLLLCHGEIFEQGGRKCLITFHPASAMRFPKIAKWMKMDFEKLR